MTFRGVGVAAVAAVVGALGAPTASAAPAGDSVVEVTDFSIAHSGAVFQQTAVAMCPSRMRATGGGAAPSPPFANGTYDGWRLNYSSRDYHRDRDGRRRQHVAS